jgi:hypothetical protein
MSGGPWNARPHLRSAIAKYPVVQRRLFHYVFSQWSKTCFLLGVDCQIRAWLADLSIRQEQHGKQLLRYCVFSY